VRPIDTCLTGYQSIMTHNIIQLDPLGSHHLFDGSEMRQTSQETEFRYCHKDPAKGRHCTVDYHQTQDPHFDEFDDASILWREVTIAEFANKGDSAYYDYPPFPNSKP
jgi:hypothetical protein